VKILSWNVHGANAKSGVWKYLLETDPDLALLQEVGGIPKPVSDRFEHISKIPVTRTGNPQRFKTCVLTKLPILEELTLQTPNDWAREQAKIFEGNLVCAKLRGADERPLHAVSVYAPAWPIERSKWANIDVAGLKLAANRDIWCTEILWDLLRHTMPSMPSQWIAGGDFNSSETFDFRAEGDRGNREIMSRLTELGFTEMLRTHHGRLVPTFKNAGSKIIIHQLDHLYVTKPLSNQLLHCEVGDEDRIIWKGLSDHLPVIAHFASSAAEVQKGRSVLNIGNIVN
jgi:exonuclease III